MQRKNIYIKLEFKKALQHKLIMVPLQLDFFNWYGMNAEAL